MSAPLETRERLAEPHLLKFCLRQMFVVLTLVCFLCALIAATDGPWPWVIGLTTLIVAAHVLGNLIGTRLRDTSADVVRWRAADPKQALDTPRMTPVNDLPVVLLPHKTVLANSGREVQGMRWYLLAGLSLGFLGAGTLLAITIGYRIGWMGWIVGSLSGGVFGVWIAFMGVSFTAVSRDALRQAHGREL